MKREHEELCARLDGYNPPDRTFDDQRQASADIHDAAAAIRELSAEKAQKDLVIEDCKKNLRELSAEVTELRGKLTDYSADISNLQEKEMNCDGWKSRAERAESELAKVNGHAEAIARGYELLDEDDLETVDAINNAVLDYRADYPRSEG